MRVKWHIKLFHTLLTYAPVIVIWTLISLIYSVYMLEYIIVLMNLDTQTRLPRLFMISSFYQDTYTSGIALCLIESFCISMMLVAMLRTVFMDPGYLPDPIKFEYSLVKKNLEYPESTVETEDQRNNISNTSNNSLINSSLSGTCDEEGVQLKRYKFIREIGNFIEDGPLTSTEFIRYRRNLEKYLNSKVENSISLYGQNNNMSALDVQNISSDDKFNYNFEDVFENFRGVDFNKLILCTTCLRWKVDRSHHCKQCGKCVLKMDHHCPWLANCIGFRNHKFFCLTIFYGFLGALIIFLTFWEVVVIVNLEYESSMFRCILFTMTYIANFGMLSFLSWLLYTNWHLVFSNQTTIENSDKERFATTGIKSFNYYDQGAYRNFTTVFGTNPLLWLLPLAPNYRGEGVLFDS